MAKLSYKTKDNTDAPERTRIYFASHPDDFNTYFEPICADIFAAQDCAVFYNSELDIPWDEDAMELELAEMRLIVIPVTSKFLYEPNEARDAVFAYAIKKHIPLLPLIQRDGLSKQQTNMPDTIEFRTEKAVICAKFGDICAAERYLQEARKWYREGAWIARGLANETGAAEARRYLSVFYNKLGNTWGNYAAKKWYKKSFEIREQLARETGAAEEYDDLAVSYCYLAAVSRRREKIYLFKEAESIWEDLAKRHPDVQRYECNLQIVREKILKAEKELKAFNDFLNGENQ
ncbi:MAG: hypothetical protein LUG52_09275 [Clostridia bacterium]|nr:hypothetical protein [Clostridia bacterium]